MKTTTQCGVFNSVNFLSDVALAITGKKKKVGFFCHRYDQTPDRGTRKFEK
jgi:hypothetical protein